MIALGILWQPFFLQPSCTPVLYGSIYYGKHWNSTDHSDNSKQGAKHQNRKQDPEASQSNRSTYDLRPYDIAIYLKYDDDQNDKDNSFDRIYQKNQKSTWNSSYILSEKRNYIGNPDQYTDQRRIGRIRNAQNNKSNNRHNNRIDYFSTKKFGKRTVYILPDLQCQSRVFQRKNGEQHSFCLSTECFFSSHKID